MKKLVKEECDESEKIKEQKFPSNLKSYELETKVLGIMTDYEIDSFTGNFIPKQYNRPKSFTL